MKKILLFPIVALTILSGCKQTKSEKTIENLKAGIIGETTASAKYASFAQKAKEDGLDQIAKLFEAASEAEAIHAYNHNQVLKSLGEEMPEFKPEFQVKTSEENIQAAIDGESYEATTMYPKFIEDAKYENAKKAVKSFQWALDTEKKHNDFYKQALAAKMNNTSQSLPAGYAVCPVCGNTYRIDAVDEKCAFCQTAKNKFITI